MEKEAQVILSKKLQVVTLCPLLSGILICTIFITSVLFGSYLSWIDETVSYIEFNEKENLIRLSTAASELLRSKIQQMVFELNTLKLVYDSDIELALNPDEILQTENAYDNNNQETDYEFSVWFRPDASDKNDLQIINDAKIALDDIFMRVFMSLDRNVTQVGIIFDKDGLDYRYPKTNMEYINGSYNSIQSAAYRNLKDEGHNIAIYNEDNMTKILLNCDFGAYIYYLPMNFFDEAFEGNGNYHFFFSALDENRTIRTFPYTGTDGAIWDALFPTDEELKIKGEPSIYESLSSLILDINATDNNTFTIEGFFREYIGGVKPINFQINTYGSEILVAENKSFVAGTIIDRGIIFSSWNDLLDGIINTILIQMVIFLIFLCITIAFVWILGMSITNRITYPIYLIEEYLKGEISIQSLDKKYNKELNQILLFLRMMETLEKMINPNFLMNPKISVRESNLKEVLKLFEDIKNHRGKAIIMNLLGNIYFMENNYQKAVSYYKSALEEVNELAKEINQQEDDEKALSEADKTILLKKARKDILNWDPEKKFLNESIIDRKQQLCMSLQAELHESSLDPSEIHIRINEIFKYQTEILQNYVSTRTYFFRILKIMIDIAGVFQELKYYNSGIDILDIVYDELRKLDAEFSPEIDIDTNRLIRIGVNVKACEINKHINFVVKGVTFEKDILTQMMYYRRGLLLLENDKYYEAGVAFTLAIEKGQFYDPKIREQSVKALHSLMEKFGLLKDAPGLNEMYKSLYAADKSLMLVLSCDLYKNKTISDDLISFVEKKIRKKWKFGALSLHSNSALKMEVILRDLPGKDLKDLVCSWGENAPKESTYDVMVNALNLFEDENSKKIMLAVICEFTMFGSNKVDDLILITDKGVMLYILVEEKFMKNMKKLLEGKKEIDEGEKGSLENKELLKFSNFLENNENPNIKIVKFGGSLPLGKALQQFYDFVKN
ncbi:hypothetical protein SteCoe_20371 [Stentor coeruleus]|uniref:Uncharacterized protein n=1 Tax=Stentor coeruleus TaxID=5963 RepID=A0A1R2BRX5_9CILI|nr:hypothetical protein SteCoe_20371 [Stentor coeruleus]